MKKFLIIAGAVLAILIVAGLVWKCQPEEPKTLTDYIVKDYTELLETKDHVIYYETQCTLDNYADAGDEDLLVVSARSIFQVHDTVYYYDRDLTNNTLEVSYVKGHWGGTFSSDPTLFLVTYEEALKNLYDSNAVKPHSNKMTLRHPLGAKYLNAQYIFGSTSSKMYVAVDAVTGDVTSLK